jgi:hypothetical protein
MLAATSAVATEDAFAGKKREYNQATNTCIPGIRQGTFLNWFSNIL